jgi:Tfp pilus assembly protein PilF
MLAFDEDDPAAAHQLIEQALAICEETVGPAHQAFAHVELALGQRQRALDHYQQAPAVLGEF